MKKYTGLKDHEKEFIDLFGKLCTSRSGWQVWADLMSMFACSISNAADRSPKHFDNREKEYAACLKRVASLDIASQLFAAVVNALDADPNQDFLGALYMKLDMGNHWKGQFFSPYSIADAMARITVEGIEDEIERKGWASVCDPCIGGGAMMIAAANYAMSKGINYQNNMLFVGQDLDRVVAQMAYIQLSLLGCPGYICVGDSLSNPLTGKNALFPQEQEGQELWYTPMFMSDVWQFRRLFNSMPVGSKSGAVTTQKTAEKEHSFMFFDFKMMEDQNGNERDYKGITS